MLYSGQAGVVPFILRIITPALEIEVDSPDRGRDAGHILAGWPLAVAHTIRTGAWGSGVSLSTGSSGHSQK